MEKRALELMGKMMEAFGPSGFEREINRIVKEEVEPIADEIITDKLGARAPHTVNGFSEL
jgi:putative aminopeptidase FrvX